MRVAEAELVAITRGSQTSADFGMVMNRHSVQTMIGKLYQDQIKAIIRELSTNAVDAHIDAGTLNRPFEVTIPTVTSREFKIRDYGTGMSQLKIMGKPGVYREETLEHDGETIKRQVCLVEPVRGLYNTFFDSDKRTSDEKNGCFGLGSKSPLGYVDSFSVTSYYGGEKKIYIVGFNTEGIPQINLMHSEPTSEPTGLEVAFMVKSSDCHQFAEKAKEVYTYFKHKPLIKGASISIPKLTYRLESDDKTWGIAGGKSIAMMGHIAYPIDVTHFATKYGDVHPNAPSRYQGGYGGNEYQRVLACGIHLDFNLGELEMTPSREALQYTKKTIDSIKKKLDEVIDHISELVSRKFKNCKNLWDARVLYVNLMSGELHPIADMVNIAGVTWKGKKVDGQIHLQTTGTNNAPGTTMMKFSGGSWSNRVHRSEGWNQIRVPENDNQIKFVENDIARGAYVGCRRLIVDNPFSVGTPNTVSTVYLLSFDDANAKKVFCDYVGIDDSYILKASSIPKPARVKGQTTNEKVFKLKDVHSGNPRDFWKAEDVDMEDGGIYAEINHYEFCKSSKEDREHPRNITAAIRKLKSFGLKIDDIVGVKSAVAKKFKEYEDAEWINVYDYLRAILDVYVKKNGLVQIMTDIQTLNSFRNWEKYKYIIDAMPRVTALNHPNKEFGTFVQRIKDLITTRDLHAKKVQDLLDLSQSVGYNLSSGPTGDLSKEEEVVLNKYEYLKLVDNVDMMRREKVDIVIKLTNQFDK